MSPALQVSDPLLTSAMSGFVVILNEQNRVHAEGYTADPAPARIDDIDQREHGGAAQTEHAHRARRARTAPPAMSDESITASRPPTVLTSQPSALGPVSFSKLRRWTIGHKPDAT
jgi:hypothetical protein